MGGFGSTAKAGSFKSAQLQFAKVRKAYLNKAEKIRKLFAKKQIPYPPSQIFLRAFKKEKTVEIWAWKNDRFALLTTYSICHIPGKMGPKRRQGDLHTPEGFYSISQFNPASQYHLSLKIDYPNRSDRIQGSKNPGGDIFLHGGCGSRGCISLTDGKVEELYLIAMEAQDQGQRAIPIHIFPARLDKREMKRLQKQHRREKELIEFWESLQKGYQHFEKNKTLFKIFVNADGVYQIDSPI